MFSHPSKVSFVDDAIAADYDVVLHVLMIPLELSGPRVERRVAAGGHDVPHDRLASRFERTWPLVAEVVSRCSVAMFYDNSMDEGPMGIATLRFGVADAQPRWPDWCPPALRTLGIR